MSPYTITLAGLLAAFAIGQANGQQPSSQSAPQNTKAGKPAQDPTLPENADDEQVMVPEDATDDGHIKPIAGTAPRSTVNQQQQTSQPADASAANKPAPANSSSRSAVPSNAPAPPNNAPAPPNNAPVPPNNAPVPSNAPATPSAPGKTPAAPANAPAPPANAPAANSSSAPATSSAPSSSGNPRED